MRRTIITAILAVTALTLAACRHNQDTIDPASYYDDETDIRNEMARQGYDAALTSTVRDTQRVVYMRLGNDTVYFAENHYGKDSAGMANGHSYRMYLTMIDMAGNRHVTLTPAGDSAYSVDSVATILLARPLPGKESELRRFATWSLYGFREPMEAALKESDEAFEGSGETLDEAMQELDEAAGTLFEFDTTIIAPGCKAQKSFERLERKGKELHFASFEIRHKAGHKGCTFECTHGLPGRDRCYHVMEEMNKAALDEGLAIRVAHSGRTHTHCTFTVHN